uniref:Growth-regulating factor n=1 Tax=Ananas comosus var. bracteatus TaxID=296719 RepID=A0A6V7NQB9_ANACO|nr:unnamed protein product [Ananas comosus var. bracteatus]
MSSAAAAAAEVEAAAGGGGRRSRRRSGWSWSTRRSSSSTSWPGSRAPDLLVPIRRSFDALPARYYHPHHHYHHAARECYLPLALLMCSYVSHLFYKIIDIYIPVSDLIYTKVSFGDSHVVDYYSYYGKKLDPEPGRCRRTDGKKWRCSKDAYPGSKYCERHMHRGRNRSRKPVESQTTASSQSQSASSSTVTGGDGAGGSSGGSFRTSPLPSLTASNSPQVSYLGRASSSRLQMDSTPYGIKYISGAKTEVGEHSFFSEASGSTRGLRMDSSVNNSWRLMPSSHDASSVPLMETRENSILESTSSPFITQCTSTHCHYSSSSSTLFLEAIAGIWKCDWFMASLE